jgi:acetyl-CoA carboxylase biotin carboxyl carrier protein
MNDKNKQPAGPEETAMSGKVDYDELRKLIGLLEEKGLSVFELEVEGLKIKISRNVPAAPVYQSVAAAAQPASEAGTPQVPAACSLPEAADKDARFVTSPMVGTFYRAPSPNAEPFVEIGDVVKKGQTLCIIEAMKLMNEIESDVDGVVASIHVENGRPVEYGQKLFAIKAVV